MEIRENFSLKKYNTFGLDVSAKLFIEIFSEDELFEVLEDNKIESSLKFFLGGGSNVLFKDNYDGLVIKNSIPGIKIVEENSDSVLIEIGAGEIWNDVVNFALERNFGGIENLVLIPGTAGAAPIQNIGAYGMEFKNTFKSLEGIFLEDLSKRSFSNDECKFAYRNSIFKNQLKDKFVITSINLRLNKNPGLNLEYGNVKEEIEKLKLENITIKDVANLISKIRMEKLPDPKIFGNAGSFFKNPEISTKKFDEISSKYSELKGYPAGEDKVKISAAWLIEKSGWKGKRIGNVEAYFKQPLVLINLGNAESSEVINFAGQIKKSVFELFGITLTEEVNVI